MEQDILEQFYFGRIVPWENRNDKTPEIEQCSEQVYRDTEHLAQLLDEDGKKILERLMITALNWKAIRFWRASRMGSGWGFSLRQPVWKVKISCKIHTFCPESLCNI